LLPSTERATPRRRRDSQAPAEASRVFKAAAALSSARSMCGVSNARATVSACARKCVCSDCPALHSAAPTAPANSTLVLGRAKTAAPLAASTTFALTA